MGKKSITDQEIGLIKAMLARGMKNKDIQFYFNRQDRPVNSGRITQIDQKTYGSEVPRASEDELNRFLAAFAPASIGAVMIGTLVEREPTLEEHAQGLFEKRGRSGWFLKTHESETTECKEGFCLKPEHRFADPLRSIAGLANNKGGFVFFGIKQLPDGSLSVVGMSDEAFAGTDPAEINRSLAGALNPVPVFSMFILDFEGKTVGAISIEKQDLPPVIAIKNVNNEFREGAIYYRYVGETRVIKPGELQQIIAYREQRAIAEFSNRISRVAMGAAATLDLDTGKVEGRVGSFTIGEELLPKIQFIREGEFSETKGAPTLRLIGDVQPATGTTRVVRAGITTDAALRNFLSGETVEQPLHYLLHSAHSGREWVPIWCYMRAAKINVAEAVEHLKAESASQPTHRDKAISRLEGRTSAFKLNAGAPKQLAKQINEGIFTQPNDEQSDKTFALAVQGLTDVKCDLSKIKAALLDCFDRSSGDSQQKRNRRSAIFRAACRLDEILFGIN